MGVEALVDKYKYHAVVLLIASTSLVYVVSDTVVKVTAMMYPSTKLVVINKTTERKNVVIREREIVYADGKRERETVTEDKSTTEMNASTDRASVAVVPKAKGPVTLWVGGGLDIDRVYHGTVGASAGPLLLTVDNPVWPARLAPRASLAVGFSF